MGRHACLSTPECAGVLFLSMVTAAQQCQCAQLVHQLQALLAHGPITNADGPKEPLSCSWHTAGAVKSCCLACGFDDRLGIPWRSAAQKAELAPGLLPAAHPQENAGSSGQTAHTQHTCALAPAPPTIEPPAKDAQLAHSASDVDGQGAGNAGGLVRLHTSAQTMTDHACSPDSL